MMQYIEQREQKFGGISKGETRPAPANYQEETRHSIFPSINSRWTYCLCEGGVSCNRCISVEGVGPPHCNYLMNQICMLSAIDEVELVKQIKLEMLPLLIGDVQTKLGKQELEKRLKS